MYANVIIEYGVKTLNKTFIYKVPDELKDKIVEYAKFVIEQEKNKKDK